jgi:hypothetical protein
MDDDNETRIRNAKLGTADEILGRILASDGDIIRAFIAQGLVGKGPDDKWVLTEKGRVALDTPKRAGLH